jgi:hypothetical protein
MLRDHHLERRRRADRIAAVVLAALSLIPVYLASEVGELILSLAVCEQLCAIFIIAGGLLVIVTLVGLGVAWSMWVGTRLGRIVGLIGSAAGALLAGAPVLQALGSEPPGEPGDLLPLAAMTLAFALAAALSGVATWDWVREVRQR